MLNEEIINTHGEKVLSILGQIASQASYVAKKETANSIISIIDEEFDKHLSNAETYRNIMNRIKNICEMKKQTSQHYLFERFDF